MAHDVTLPSGEIVTFPDEMSDDDINKALGSYGATAPGAGAADGTGAAPGPAAPAADASGTQPPAPDAPAPAPPPDIAPRPAADQPPGTVLPPAPNPNLVVPPPDVMRPGRVAGYGLVKGGTEAAGLPGDLASYLLPPEYQVLPTSQSLQQSSLAQSLMAGNEPKTGGERAIAATTEGIGSAVPLALTGSEIPGTAALLRDYLTLAPRVGSFPGVGSLASTATRAAVEGGAAGLGGEQGQQYGPLGGVAGTAAGLAGGGLGLGILGRGGRALLGADAPLVAAYDRLGITPRLAGDMTGGDFLKGVQSAALRSPGGAMARGARDATIDQFGAAGDTAAARLGTAQTLDDAGNAVQNEARSWLTNWKADQAQAWGAVNAKVPASAPVAMSGVDGALNQTMAAMPNMPEVAKTMNANPVFQELRLSLAHDIWQRGDPLNYTAPWESVRGWQQRVGNELESSLVAGNPAAAQWKLLYGALSDATEQAAAASGAGAEYQAAKDLTSQGHTFLDSTVNKVINAPNVEKNTITPSAAATWALGQANAGGDRLQGIRDQMPAAADALGAYKLRNMVKAPAGMQTPGAMAADLAGNTPSPLRYATEYSNLAPEARAALFGSNAQTAADVDDLQRVAGSMKSTYKEFGNPSGTAGAAEHALSGLGGIAGAYEGWRRGYDEEGGSVGKGLAYALGGLIGGGLVPRVPGIVGSLATTRPGLTRVLAQPGIPPVANLPARAGLLTGAFLPQLPRAAAP